MFRALAAVGVIAACVPVASAQPVRLPLSPGVTPASPIGPGTQFLPPLFVPNGPQLMAVPVMAPWGYPTTPVYGTAFGGLGIGYPYGGVVAAPPIINVTQSVTNVSAPGVASTTGVVPTREFPATLALQFTYATEVWVNGKKLDGDAADEWTVSSPALKPGESYTFQIKARWKTGGKTYEATRSVTLSAGDRSRLIVVSGTEVG
jgi:uncharacterized protein (TIGR03000 family)